MDPQMSPQSAPQSAPQPAPQPVSMHRHSSAPIVALLLGLLLVGETALMGYGAMQYSTMRSQLVTVQAALDATNQPEDGCEDCGADSEEFEVPLLYVEGDKYPNSYGQKIVKIDRETGEEKILRQLEPAQYAKILAIPQRNYGGEVFLHVVGEGDNPYISLYKMYYDGSRLERVNFFNEAKGEVFYSAVAVSPDQTKIAYIPFTGDEASPSPEIIVYNLITGKSEIIAKLSDMAGPSVTVGYSFALVDEDAFGGMSGMEFAWKDNSCINAGVYSLDATPKIDFQTFCEK